MMPICIFASTLYYFQKEKGKTFLILSFFVSEKKRKNLILDKFLNPKYILFFSRHGLFPPYEGLIDAVNSTTLADTLKGGHFRLHRRIYNLRFSNSLINFHSLKRWPFLISRHYDLNRCLY